MARRTAGLLLGVWVVISAGAALAQTDAAPPPIRLMTLDPGHFHAGLVHRETYPDVSPRVDVYAPLGPDLLAHLKRVAGFNTRPQSPTDWRVDVHTGPDFFERLRKEKPGNVVVISGRNRAKIDYIQGSVQAGLHALVDKPWILEVGDFEKLRQTLDAADDRGLVAFDMMTERFEVTSLLQRELVRDPAVFGAAVPGTAAEPGAYMESVHHLMKVVAGSPNIRPTWFFDTTQQGEGLNDIGTHLVDLVQWTLFPEQAIDYRTDVAVIDAFRWPTVIPLADFERVTGERVFPTFLGSAVKDGQLDYFANTYVTYRLRGIHVGLDVIWDWEAPAGRGDTHFAFYRGTLSKVEVRQGKAESYRPEVYLVPSAAAKLSTLREAVARRLASRPAEYPGVTVEEKGGELHLVVPDALRVSHEEHFGQVARRFFSFLRDRNALPAWEKPNMLAKYWVTTKGTELSRQAPPRIAERRAPQ